MSYGKKKMRPEYWFSVPKNRVDELFKFLQAWVPHLYGELDEEKVSKLFYSYVLCFTQHIKIEEVKSKAILMQNSG